MDDPPLHDMPEIETVAVDDDDNNLEYVTPNPTEHGTWITKTCPLPNPTTSVHLPPKELTDRTFLMPPNKDGSCYRAKIVGIVNDHVSKTEGHPEVVKLKCIVNDQYEEVVAYNKIIEFIEDDQTWDGAWKFRKIHDHQGPIRASNPRYKGSRWNVLIEWETGEKSWEPLSRTDKTGVYETDPVTVAIYAQEHKLLNTPGWMLPGMKKMAKTQKRLIRRANQAKLHSYRTKPVYMYGFQVPRNHDQAMDLDTKNGNNKLREYKAFENKECGYTPDPDSKKIRCHMVYCVKHDGRHKSRLVAGGHLTETPIDSVYSSVVPLRGIRLITFIAKLNDLEVWCTDIGNAYLESYTKEKVYIIAGPEFGKLEGCTLIIHKALYGLKSSGLRWHERFADVLRDMGFFLSKGETDIWMRDKGDHYEYIAVYVDDLLIASKDPKAILPDLLQVEHHFKLKGTGPISFHLGCDFFRDKDGNLCYAPNK